MPLALLYRAFRIGRAGLQPLHYSPAPPACLEHTPCTGRRPPVETRPAASLPFPHSPRRPGGQEGQGMWQRAISLLNQPFYNGPAFHGERFRKAPAGGLQTKRGYGSPAFPGGPAGGRLQGAGGWAFQRAGWGALDKTGLWEPHFPRRASGRTSAGCRGWGREAAERRRGIEPLDGVSTRISPGRRALLTGDRRSV